MKKGFILALLLISVLTLSSAVLANERQVISIKGGLNSFSLEWEKISGNGSSFFITETAYSLHAYANDWYPYSTTLFGMRKHTAVKGNHTYIGGALGICGWVPTVDAHVGYEFHPAFLPSFLNARAEAGASLVVDWDFSLHPVLHAGVGVGFDFDWSMLF